MKRLQLLILLLLPLLYGFAITNSPAISEVLTGTNSIEIILDFTTDVNGNASKVYFYYKNLSEEEDILFINSSTNFTKYSYSFNTSGFEDTLNGQIMIIATNYTQALENVSLSIPVKLDNDAPIYSILPNLTWPEDKINNTLNVTAYFSDTEKRNKFTYTMSSIDDVEVSVNSDTGIATIEPNNNFSGIRYIRFTASDGTLSNTSNEIMLNITPINDPPMLKKSIENRTWVKNTDMVIKVHEYFTDVDNDELTYSYSVEGSHVTVSMDPDGIATLTPENDFLGKDAITFTASDSNYSASSNKVYLEIIGNTNNKPPVIGSANPTEKNINMGKDESMTFSISKSDADNDTLSVKWYVNGEMKTSDADTYAFSSSTPGSYIIKVEVSDGIETSSNSWVVTIGIVENITTSETIEEKCGNGIVDADENCENCAKDVLCKDDESCINRTCTSIKKESNLALIIGLLFLVLVITVAVVFLYQRRKKKDIFSPAKDINVSNLKTTIGNDGKAQQYYNKETKERPPAEISDFYFPKKEDAITYIGKDAKKGASRTENALLRNYIKMALERKLSPEKIKKNLSSKGWSMEQIEKTLKESRSRTL